MMAAFGGMNVRVAELPVAPRKKKASDHALRRWRTGPPACVPNHGMIATGASCDKAMWWQSNRDHRRQFIHLGRLAGR